MKSNGKWMALSEKLQVAGWWENRSEPRVLERQYHAGRAVLVETSEQVGDRTIFAFGAYWPTKRGKPYEAYLWFRNLEDMKKHFVPMLEGLIEKIPLSTSLTVECILLDNREAKNQPKGGTFYFGGRE